MSFIADFVQSLPKAELHLHIEGSLEPELMMALAARNHVKLPFASVEDIRRAYEFQNLQEFLDIYYQGMSVLQREEDFYDLTMAYLRRVHADNCRHVEIFFDPQGHTERGVSFATAIDGILRGLADGEKEFGITAHLIMSFLRHLSEEDAFETLEQSKPWHDRILGVGLDSSEMGHPPSKFERVFAAAHGMGLKSFAHGGEEGPPAYVYECLDLLQVDRLDHGNRSLEDEALTARLVEAQIALTVCPLSNLKLCVVDDLQNHPLKVMIDKGLKVTINSDDPSYFGGYLNDNYIATAEALDLSKEDLALCARNSITASYMDAGRQKELLAEIDGLLAETIYRD
jgi:adenine deaminase